MEADSSPPFFGGTARKGSGADLNRPDSQSLQSPPAEQASGEAVDEDGFGAFDPLSVVDSDLLQAMENLSLSSEAEGEESVGSEEPRSGFV